MSDREKLLELLDDFKSTIVKMMDERDSLQSEGEELRTDKREAEEKSWAAEEKVKELESELEKTKNAKDTAETELAMVKAELESVKARADEAESSKTEAVDAVRAERDELRKEMDEINEQLGRVSELYREASAEKDALKEKVDVSDLLAIYITLIETVFYGKPHARILYTLHDVKTSISRKNIASSTGIMPAAVLKAVHDLANADLVKYDEETQDVELTKDILRRG
jgi:DNA repair exonuclease SbcCD ATPase subunit